MSYVGPRPKFDWVKLKDQVNTALTNPLAGYWALALRYGRAILRNPSGIEADLMRGTQNNYCLLPSVYIPAATSSDLGWYNSGGTPTTITSGLPQESLGSAIQFVSTTTGDYLRYRFKLNDVDLSRRLAAACSMIAVLGDYKLEVYSGTDAALSSAAQIIAQSIYTNASGVTNLPGGTFDFLANFDTSTRQFYEIRWVALGSSKTIKVSGATLSASTSGISTPSSGIEIETVTSYVIGAVTTPPTAGAGATYYRNTVKDGNWAIIRYEFRQAAAGSAGSGDYLLPIPSGLNIDYTRVTVAGVGTSIGHVGHGSLTVNSNQFFAEAYTLNSGSYINKIFLQYSNDASPNVTWGANGSLANGAVALSVTVRIPIQEWLGNNPVPGINPIAQSPIRAGTIQQFAGATTPAGWLDCDGSVYTQNQYPQLFAQIGATWATCTNPLTGSAYSAPSAGSFRVPDLRAAFLRGAGGPNAAGVTTSLAGYQADTTAKNGLANASTTTVANTSGTASAAMYVSNNNQPNKAYSSFAAPGYSAGDTNYDVSSHYHNIPALTVNAAGMTGDAETRPDNVGIKHIIKAWDESFNTAGFLQATATTLGMVSGGTVPGQTSGTAIAAGMVGQVVSSFVSTPTNAPGASGAYGDALSITLTAGTWLINGAVRVTRNGATFASTDVALGASTTSGNSGAGLVGGINYVNETAVVSTTFSGFDMIVPPFLVRSDGTTITKIEDNTAFATGSILYLKLYLSSFTVATPQFTGKISATRIA